jgi:signal peptidase I
VTGTQSIPQQLTKGVIWAIMVTGALLALLIAGPLALGDHPATDLTGSMEPTISPGDVVINEEIAPTEAKVGDIVTFRDPEQQSKLLTHRVVAIKPLKNGHYAFVTQGDANNTQEHWRVPTDGQIGRVVYTVPWVGNIAVFARTRLGMGLLIGIPLLLILLEEMFKIWRPRESREPQAPQREERSVGDVG